MGNNIDLKQTYNQIAGDWHRDHRSDTWWQKDTDRFISFLKPGELVLDVGCAGGTKAKYLLKKGLRVVGIDFSEKMIAIAQQEAVGGTFLVLDLKDIDQLDYLFDGIFMQAVLLHIPKQEAKPMIEKLTKKLRQGGYLYIAAKERKPGGVEEEIKTEEEFGYQYKRFFSYFTMDEIKNILQGCGFDICHENITPSGNTRWLQIVGKKN
jgi:2-polyprenyl-3-methyl-5-hydroxy-6-metoxy-1,4-benzoquinol methylase